MGNHRAATRGRLKPARPTSDRATVRPSGPSTGRRRAARTSRRRVRGLGLAPTLVGIAALLVAGAGASGLGHLGNGLQLSSGGSHISGGTDAFAFAGTDARSQAISRDSDRQAMADATQSSLQRATDQQGQQRNAALTALARSAEKRAHQLAKDVWVLPVDHYVLTARFGMTSGLWSSFHTGLDFACPVGTPIHAIATGVITSTGWAGAYGNLTIETLPDGTELYYAHQSEIDVHPKQEVAGGQVIGKVGATGNTTGPHVHIEVRPGGGDPVDPYAAFVFHGVRP